MFWRKKRAGEIDAPSPQEQARVPAVLLDIALKAMAADPAARYASAEALLGDLQAYQRGQAVTAHREGLLEFAGRLWRSHGRRWSAMAAVVAIIAVLVGMLYGERVKEIARWGRPILVDEFEGQTFGSQWLQIDGGFHVEHGRLVSQQGSNHILLDHRLSGPTAIEYDAEITPGSHLGDLSLIWCSDRSLDARGKTTVTEAIRCQIGAFDGAYSAIEEGGTPVAFSTFRPVFGRIYHVRDEFVGDRVSMSIDGRQQCSWRSQFPLDDGYAELYATYAHHAFSHVRVFSQGIAQKVSATAIGDALVEMRRYEDAAQAYARVAVSFADTELGREARFREGVCRWRLSQWQEAFAAWASLKGTPQEGYVALYALKRAFASKRFDDVVAGLERLCVGASPELLHEIALAWGEEAEAMCRSGDVAHIKQFLSMHDRCFADQAEVDGQCADCLLKLGLNDDVLSRFAYQDHHCVLALGAQQRWPDIVSRYPDQLWDYNIALLNTAQDDRIECDLDPPAKRQMLLRTCRFEELMKQPDSEEEQSYALLYQGRFDDLERGHRPYYFRDDALALTGHVDLVSDESYRLLLSDQAAAAQRLTVRHCERWEEAQMRIGLEDLIASGDSSRLDQVQQVEGLVGGDLVERLAFDRTLLRPFLKGLKSGWGAFDTAIALTIRDDRYLFQQQMWYAASWLRGDLDDQSFLKQPHRLFAPAHLALITGMRAERAGRTAAALAAYVALQAMPSWQRDFELDPTLIRFVAWRCERPPPRIEGCAATRWWRKSDPPAGGSDPFDRHQVAAEYRAGAAGRLADAHGPVLGLGAGLGTRVADFCAGEADHRFVIRLAAEEIGACAADGGAVEQQPSFGRARLWVLGGQAMLVQGLEADPGHRFRRRRCRIRPETGAPASAGTGERCWVAWSGLGCGVGRQEISAPDWAPTRLSWSFY